MRVAHDAIGLFEQLASCLNANTRRVIRQALIKGEQSGDPRPFDFDAFLFDAFLKDMDAANG
ncbi:type II toxin-antitoxin system ParD family antitoxin [Sphingobium phenoxybenzoativorans]|uniref:Type II toxin-antitoxin system ParD family antitoxin n=1 Tax=Sphingobium phenoxybenzoativorans TaxID=1592790 RepID=A0A975K9G5_9SPHN|nr:type II toxin-antitoxin system ParD family antitoxin [Sphingobium phenoxybenzoativorans]QUT05887.1 type II toxin-antitoxin system ParD family antitoxin [Sphingobium phenoxybenzoativorans]